MASSPTLETNVQALEKELILYQPLIPELLEVDDTFFAMLDKTDSDPASNRATRIPLLVSINGRFQQANMDNADLGGTSGPIWAVATLTPNYYTFGVSMSQQAIYAATGTDRAVKQPLQETIRLSMKQLRSALDMLSNTGGNGVLGTITSVSTNALTMITDGFKAELFYVGMPVDVYNTGLTTNRGSTFVSSIDKVNNIVNVAAAPGGTVATDKLLIAGLAATVTIQSSLFGLQYHQSNASTGLWMGLDRATYPNIRTPSVNANSSALTTAPLRLAKNLIREQIGTDAIKSGKARLTAYTHLDQADAYESLAITISQIFKDPSGNQGVDLLFGNEDNMKFGDTPITQSIHADRTRIDYLCLSNWGRIQATDTGFYSVGGQTMFPTYGAGGDSLKSSFFFYLKTGLQIYNKNPLAGSYIYSLAVPSGY